MSSGPCDSHFFHLHGLADASQKDCCPPRQPRIGLPCMKQLAGIVRLLGSQRQQRQDIVDIQHILAGMVAGVEVLGSKELQKLCCLHSEPLV